MEKTMDAPPGEEALLLKNQLCFPLYACAREIVKRYKPFLDPLGLTYTQYLVMIVLWEKRQVTAKALGDCLLLDSGTLTPLLKKMEVKGLLTRTRSQADERNLLVTITAGGEALKKEAASVPPKMAECAGLTPQEAGELYRLLYKMLNNRK